MILNKIYYIFVLLLSQVTIKKINTKPIPCETATSMGIGFLILNYVKKKEQVSVYKKKIHRGNINKPKQISVCNKSK